MYPTPRTKRETIDLPVTATYPGNKIQFPDIPELRSDIDKDAIVYGIQVYCSEVTPNTFNGNPVADWAKISECVLTLYVVGTEQQFNIPLPRLLNMQTPDSGFTGWFSREPFYFAPQRIDWTKSYVQQCSGNLATGDAFSFYFEVTYDWCPAGSYSEFMKKELNLWSQGMIKL